MPVAVDAPELAGAGPFAVGWRTRTIVDPLRVDVLRADHRVQPRRLVIDIWYPASAHKTSPRVRYAAALPTASGGWARFTIVGAAHRDAVPVGGRYPLVIVSHGYSNAPAEMSWLTENLASKGYVVAAIRHDDPPITDTAKFGGPLHDRPLDIAATARALASERDVDADRTALIGYSMGGYGVLTAAGARLDPDGIAGKLLAGEPLVPLTVKAVVAIAPAGGGALRAWGNDGLSRLPAPLLLIAGTADRVVDYASGARAIFAGAVAAPRYLLTFKGAGHAIGLGAAPPEMRGTLWDQDWFEDPVWRKDRLNAVTLHVVTAFLDRFVKNDAARAAYLDVNVPDADTAIWPAPPAAAYDAFGTGTGASPGWKGFRRNHAVGLMLEHAEAR